MKVSSIVAGFSATPKVMLGLLGDAATMHGSTMFSILMTRVRVTRVAVAVRAINLTLEGMRLLDLPELREVCPKAISPITIIT